MASKSYRKGYRFEKEVQKWFEERGYLVFRQGKSKFPDLIAIPRKDCCPSAARLIECKYNKKPTKEEIEKLIALEEKYNVITWFAIKEKGERDFRLITPFSICPTPDAQWLQGFSLQPSARAVNRDFKSVRSAD